MLFGEGPQIKNIAADLNKLFRQGSLLNQSVQTVEGDSTADQGTSDLLAARDPVIQEISVGMSGKQSARYTVSGTPPLSLTNSLGKPLKAWSVDLLPNQEGTGDPAPDNVRPIHGTDKLNLFVADSYDPTATPTAVIDVPPLGKNLIDSRTALFNREINSAGGWAYALSAKSIAVHVKPNTTYVLSGYPNDMSVYRVGLFNGSLPEDIDHSTYELSGVSRADNYATFGSNKVITTGIDTNYIIIQFNAARWDDAFQTTQLEVGSTPTSYEPYNATVYTGTIGSEGGESRDKLITLTGATSERWGNYSPTYHGFSITLDDANINGIPSEQLMSDKYKGNTTRGTPITWSDNLMLTYGSTADIKWVFFTTTITDVAEWRAWLADNPIQLKYPVLTPTQFPLTAPPIPTPTGTATTWATAEDGTVDSMEVTYVGKA